MKVVNGYTGTIPSVYCDDCLILQFITLVIACIELYGTVNYLINQLCQTYVSIRKNINCSLYTVTLLFVRLLPTIGSEKHIFQSAVQPSVCCPSVH